MCFKKECGGGGGFDWPWLETPSNRSPPMLIPPSSPSITRLKTLHRAVFKARHFWKSWFFSSKATVECKRRLHTSQFSHPTCLHAHMWVLCVVPLPFKTVPLCAAVTPLRCPLDGVVTPRFTFQERLRDTMSHPDFSPTLPREALKVCHPWQQPYISWGSLLCVW